MTTQTAADPKSYSHTQPGKLILGVTLGLAMVMTLVGWFTVWQTLIAVPILLGCAWLFHSLAIEIGGGELRWRFGPGLIRKRVALADIAAVKVVRTNWIEGWGIHLSRFGWLYNVSGFNAVAVTLQSGKCFALGTDEPQVLAAQLNAATRKG